MKKAVILYVISLLLCMSVLAQQPVKVPETHCAVNVPEGFTAAKDFKGFQQQSTKSAIIINELSSPYATIVAGFTEDAMKTRGMTLLSKETVQVNGKDATMVTVTQVSNGTNFTKHILIFPTADGTALVNGLYPQSSKQLESEIKKAMFSTVCD